MAQTDRPQNIPHWYSPESEVLSLSSGEGARVTDDEGTEYLDFVAQLYCVNAGHSNESIIQAMTGQARQIPYVSSSKTTPARDELAGRLAERAPGALNDVFFSISGSEANESAIQIAREYQDAPKVLTRWRSYHGSTYAAGGLSGDPETRGKIERYAATTGIAKFLPPLVHNSPFDGDTPEEIAQQAADHLEFVIKNEGPDSIAAVLTEPVAGTSGAYPAPPGYFERVREICDKYDVLLISDEVIAGFGRCGDWFGINTYDVEPDMITFAKGVTSAYAPLGGVLAREDIAAEVRKDGHDLGQTFAGHPVGCAAANAAMDAYEDGLIENCQELAPYIESELRALGERHEEVAHVHGRGLLWSVEFGHPETGEPFVDTRVEPDADNPVGDVREVAQEHGVLFGGGRPDTQVLLSPPLCIDRSDIDEAVAALEAGIEATF
ncbi:MAG: aminotransferase class III-fold pyridoxal phosphate-dependent enzyme [Halolamina sp.]|uniref:aminotransferase family protein n=1 Tax=Halolamina sp. TaxID=1940283 RepID=UPI002FC2F96F